MTIFFYLDISDYCAMSSSGKSPQAVSRHLPEHPLVIQLRSNAKM